MIYLDNAATTPLREEVVEVIHQALLNDFGNPSSIYKKGKSAKHAMILAKKSIADSLNIDETSLYITSGATEANNWAIRSQAKVARELTGKNHIVTTAIEHPSVAKVTEYLESEGFQITYINPSENGEFLVQDYLEATREDTMGWIAMAVNNEVGSILPVFELGDLAREKNLWFHVDTVQAIGHLNWDFSKLSCTSFVGSAHKFNGPKGVGFMVYRPFDKQMRLLPLLYGGGQENERRSGTENVPYILGMAKALEIAIEEQDEVYRKHSQLTSYLLEELKKHQIDYEINGDRENKVPYINSLWIKGQDASQLLIKFDLADVYLSAGSACSAGSLTESAILKAYHPNDIQRWQESIRLSFGMDSTINDIDFFINKLKNIIKGEVNLWHSQK